MSNKSVNNRGEAYVSEQTNLNKQRNPEGDLLKIALVIFSLIASIYLFISDSFLTTQEDLFAYTNTFYEDDISDLVVTQFNYYCFDRFDINVNGFVLGSLLMLIGILGIITIVNSKSKGSTLAIITAIIQLPIGALLIISSSFSKAGVNRMIEMVTTPMYAMSAFKTAYWLEVVCYGLFFASTIMLALSAKNNRYKVLESALIAISIGFLIMLLASIFSIDTVSKYIDIYYSDAHLSYTPAQIAGSLITTVILTALAKILVIVAFLFGLIGFQRKTNRHFVIFFSFSTAIFCILKVINTMLSIIYTFSVIPDGFSFDAFVYIKRVMTTTVLGKINLAFYWIIFIAGVFGVLKSLAFGEMSALIDQRITERSFNPVYPVHEEILVDEVAPIPQQGEESSEERFCTVCGTIATDDSIVCSTCGAYVRNE